MSSERIITIESYDEGMKKLHNDKEYTKLTINFPRESKINNVQLNTLLKVIPTLKTVEIIRCPSTIKVIWLPRNITKFIGSYCCFLTKVYGAGLTKVKLTRSLIYISDKCPITHIKAYKCNYLGKILFPKIDLIRLEYCSNFNIGRCIPNNVELKMCNHFSYWDATYGTSFMCTDNCVRSKINNSVTRINAYLPKFGTFIKSRLLLLNHKRNIALEESLMFLPKDIVSIISNFDNKNIKFIKDGF
jgi:hypothetical protein